VFGKQSNSTEIVPKASHLRLSQRDSEKYTLRYCDLYVYFFRVHRCLGGIQLTCSSATNSVATHFRRQGAFLAYRPSLEILLYSAPTIGEYLLAKSYGSTIHWEIYRQDRFCLPTCLLTYLPTYRSACLPICLLAYMPACLPMYPSILPSVRPSIRPSVRPSVRPFVHPSIHPSVHPSIHLSVYPRLYNSLLELAVFQFLNPTHSRWYSLDGGSARRKAATYIQNNTK
jgi:hypothetical protein